MKYIFLIAFTLFFNPARSQNTYYVAINGDNNNNGLSENNPWQTIAYATQQLTQGDHLYVKAGDYGNENIQFPANGTPELPITIEGYHSTPGDITVVQWEYNDPMVASFMPLLTGVDRTVGDGINLDYASYINIYNFQIQNYERGIYGYNPDHINISNVYARDFGDVNADYNGVGITLGSLASNLVLDNCMVLNSCAEGIAIVGDHCQVINCKVYADDNATGNMSAMDYYIHLSGDDNLVENCYIERFNNIEHSGHAIGLKGDCENNVVRNCVAKGFEYYGFNVRHAGSKNNLFENCTAINCGITVREGSNNIFRNCKTINATYAIMFWDTHDNDGENAGHHNLFENCIFQNTIEDVIAFHYFAYPSSCHDNVFMNCVFDGGQYLFTSDRVNFDNSMVNCIVTNVETYSRTQLNQAFVIPVDFDFVNTNFWNTGFDVPDGVDVFNYDPQFVNSDNGNYHLASSSPSIDGGTSINAPQLDFDGIIRPQGAGVDIGPYEYTTTTPVISLQLHAYLEGAYDSISTYMTEDINSLNLLPLVEPYTLLGFEMVNSGEETAMEYVFDDYGNNTIVDWLLVELRDGNNPQLSVATIPALIQRDGDIVSTDGVSDLSITLPNPQASIYVVLRHRNHFGVRSMDAYPTNNLIQIDFSDPFTPIFGENAMNLIDGKMMMVAGDANYDGQVNIVDVNEYWRPQNSIPYQYLYNNADFNLDGTINSVDRNTYWRVNISRVEALD